MIAQRWGKYVQVGAGTGTLRVLLEKEKLEMGEVVGWDALEEPLKAQM